MGLTHGGQWRTVRHCDPLQEPTELLELVSEHKEGLMSTAMASFFSVVYVVHFKNPVPYMRLGGQGFTESSSYDRVFALA